MHLFCPRRESVMPSIDISELYESGKHRRYTLLFAVNGGTLAIAKYLAGDLKGDAYSAVIGGLTIGRLSLGMLFFTIVMVWDIYAFGSRMHKVNSDLFRMPGRLVLCLIGSIICVGWLVAGSYIAADTSMFGFSEGAAIVLTTIIVTWMIHEAPELRSKGLGCFVRSLVGLCSDPQELQQDKQNTAGSS